MPPRYAYWTIIAGGLPTAFRAADRDELLPTFQRIREKHPDAVMKWFARGKLWDSPEAARIPREDRGGHRGKPAFRPDRQDRPSSDRTDRDRRDRPSAGAQDKRGRDWRPGGQHRDPRQKFIDANRQRNAEFRKERWEKRAAKPPTGQRPYEKKGERASTQGRHQRDWRPGGEHRDPRQNFGDANRQRNTEFRKERWEKRTAKPPAGPRPYDKKGEHASTQGRRERDWRPGGEHRDSRQNFGDAGRRYGADVRPKPWEDRDRSRPSSAPAWQKKGNFPAAAPGKARESGKRWSDNYRANSKYNASKRKPGPRGHVPREPEMPPGPNREPKPHEMEQPTQPPRPDEPIIPSPGPPERGRPQHRRPFQPRGNFRKGPRR